MYITLRSPTHINSKRGSVKGEDGHVFRSGTDRGEMEEAMR